jgi:hypothetical protein
MAEDYLALYRKLTRERPGGWRDTGGEPKRVA